MMTVVLLVMVVTGIMNTMWVAIRERTREIGTLRTLGMERGSVTLRPASLSVAMLIVAVTTGVAAVLPALRASKLRPIVAMSHR